MANGTDFPFDIMDVTSLLCLNIRRKGAGQLHVDCPICGDRRGKMTVNLARNVWHCNYCGEGGGMLALYGKARGLSNPDAYQEICEALQTGHCAPAPNVPPRKPVEHADVPQSQRASDQEIHRTLGALLQILALSPAHREHLRTRRGLTDEQIDWFGFRSTPPAYQCRLITATLTKMGCTISGVPGFYQDSGGRWTVKFHTRTSGILIPIQGVDGLIHGLQTRLDHPIRDKDDPPGKQGTKYLPLSSTGKPMGVTSGSPIHFVGNPCSRVVYVTEGALKADIAHALTGPTLAATAGANNTSGLDGLFAVLGRSGTEEIIEAQDMDKYSNKMVNAGSLKIHQLAAKHGMACRRLVWNPNYKGIDDWQLALHRKNNEKERVSMNFKEMYLNGMCPYDYIDSCADQWRNSTDIRVSAAVFLGLTHEEYQMYLQTVPGASLKECLDQQRHIQKFRVYQLDTMGIEIYPFAFRNLETMHKAGYEQPPAGSYQLVCDGELIHPREMDENAVLDRIYERCNDCLPEGYHGHSLSMSDVVALYAGDAQRFFYCDEIGFVPVEFDAAAAKPMRDVDKDV